MEKSKKGQPYQLFGAMGLTREEFEDWFNSWEKRYEKEGLEDSLPEIPNETKNKINEYIKGEHTIKEMYNYVETLLIGIGYDPKIARETALAELIFQIIKPIELLYFMRSLHKD